MNLTELLNQMTELGNRIRNTATQLAAQANDPNVSIADLEARQNELADMNKRLAALQAAYQTQQATAAQNVQPMPGTIPAAGVGTLGGGKVQDMRASNEYARAFAFAMRNGINRKNGGSVEQVKILFDALTESTGTPAGSDGGFLVPEDLDLSIRERRRALNPLADLFNAETVTAPTGWRIMDEAPGTGMTKVNEMATIPTNDQPKFGKVPYAVEKYGLIVPASNELLTDNISNLFGYLSKWFSKKQVLTENTLLLAAMRKLTASALGADGLSGLKKVLNILLDPEISAGATIICNQTGFDYLDQLKDTTGRGLLQPDPTNATQYCILGRAVKLMSNKTMANVTADGSATADIFIGDAQEYATLFTGQGFEVVSTDVGGNAFRTDSTEVRGIVRMGVSVFDNEAMVRRSVSVTA